MPQHNAAHAVPPTSDSVVAAAEVMQFNHDAVTRAISLISATKGSSDESTMSQPSQIQPLAAQSAQPTWPADSDSQAVTQQYQPVDSAAATAASRGGQPGACMSFSTTEAGPCAELEAVAEAIMRQGCDDEGGALTHIAKPFLPGLLKTLCHVQTLHRYTHDQAKYSVAHGTYKPTGVWSSFLTSSAHKDQMQPSLLLHLMICSKFGYCQNAHNRRNGTAESHIMLYMEHCSSLN